MAGGLGAYIALMRPKNLVLAGATVPLGAYFALMDGVDAFPVVAVVLHVLAVVLFTGAGNAMNDIKDAEIDKTAHPMRPLPSGQLTVVQASRFTSLLWTLSVGAHIGGLLAVEPSVSTYLPTVLIYILCRRAHGHLRPRTCHQKSWIVRATSSSRCSSVPSSSTAHRPSADFLNRSFGGSSAWCS